MQKFNRNYLMSIQVDDDNRIEFGLPFSIEFQITRNTLASANTGKFKIYNLQEDKREQIYKDQYDTLNIKLIELKAGYGNDLSTIFKGWIKRAYSEHNGTNNITTIEAYDGGVAFISGQTSNTFNADTPKNDVLNSLVKSLPGVSIGAIGNFEGKLSRGNSYFGNTANLLSEITNGGFYVDNNKTYCLNKNECIEGNIQVITSESGLLEAPIREEQNITCKIIFEPRLLVGQIIELKSSINPRFNGQYKVIGFNHNGTISPAVNGQCMTKVNLYYGTALTKLLAK
ncbi:MAG: hypothetical protein LBT79_07955 [Elusimicrobiota bacterium]|jgi:hypothetical protein|nr:hypothetical protein [Elusimicrobiota bacterium]